MSDEDGYLRVSVDLDCGMKHWLGETCMGELDVTKPADYIKVSHVMNECCLWFSV